MTDKKILDAEQKKIADEVLSDNEAEKVVGGVGGGKITAHTNAEVVEEPDELLGSTGH